MPKQRTYCFTALTEMRGVIGAANWAKPSMREAINMGTGPWFCLFVDGKYRAAVEMSKFLITLGFRNAYEYTKSEVDARKLANAALLYRGDKMSRQEFERVRYGIEQKYARKFESRPLLVANRLASDNPCAVAAAACLDGVAADWDRIGRDVLDYARKVIRA